jgi:hypothetical protein
VHGADIDRVAAVRTAVAPQDCGQHLQRRNEQDGGGVGLGESGRFEGAGRTAGQRKADCQDERRERVKVMATSHDPRVYREVSCPSHPPMLEGLDRGCRCVCAGSFTSPSPDVRRQWH